MILVILVGLGLLLAAEIYCQERTYRREVRRARDQFEAEITARLGYARRPDHPWNVSPITNNAPELATADGALGEQEFEGAPDSIG